jgi:predicted Zn-dependent protease
MLVSEAQEIQMGQQYDSQVVATVGLYPDAAMQGYIQQLGARLAATSERPNLPWTFRVVNDPAVNAFALPGGFIYVTRGIMANLNSEAELASVVGHEIGHVTARHSAAEMSKQQLIGLGLMVGSAASSTVARYAGIANQALQILYLKFSRDDESQADQLGLRYMQRGKYDPREMPKVFLMLGREGAAAGGGQLPEWLATHPNPEHRYERINQQIAALPQEFSGTVVDRDPYLQRLQGLIYGVNPREGYFVGSQFFHPELGFRVTFPEGWTTNNGAQAVIAVSPAQDAAVELSAATEPSADAASRAFLSQPGITGGTPRASLSGLPAVTAPFVAASGSDTLRGTVEFVKHGNAVYRVIGYAPGARWSTNQAAVERTLASFQPLTDPAALNVQPQRMQLVRLDRRTTIAELARQRPSPVPAATLALINQVELDTPLAAGQLVKWVTGSALPRR